jgi:16S rRNA (uracil1498-N3)-methyltransferase
VAGEEGAYLGRVLRLRRGDNLEIIDVTQRVYPAQVKDFADKKVAVEISGRGELRVRDLEITLALGIIRLNKMDSLVEKAAEMGVARIVPLYCRRGLPLQEGRGMAAREERWRRLALQAARKVGRGYYPEIERPVFFADFLVTPPGGDTKLIFWEEEGQQSLKDLLRLPASLGEEKITLVLGPEGGFTPEEVAGAREKGFLPVSLGRQIFTVETALMVILSILRYERGNLGSLTQSGEGK